MESWPDHAMALIDLQNELAARSVPGWEPPPDLQTVAVGGCWVCFPRGISGPGERGDPAWAAAVVIVGTRVVASRTVKGVAAAPYAPGLLALREGPVLAEVIDTLAVRPDVLLVNATGRDHPRRAGLALHLGAVVDLPSVGVTHRPLLARGDWPVDHRGATSPLWIDHELVATWVRTAPGRRPVAVSPGWRMEPEAAADIVARQPTARRTPEPLRQARRLARSSRATDAA